MSILEVNRIRPFSGDNVTISSLKNIQIQADLHVSGTVTAENFHTTTVTSSVMFQSGSTQMGNSADDSHIIVGGVYHTGQTEQTGFYFLTGDLTQSGDYRLTGNKNHTGNLLHTGSLVRVGNTTLIGTGSITGRIEHTGYTQHTGDVSVSGSLSSVGGDIRLDGTNIDIFGDVTIDGTLTTTSGSDTNLQGKLKVTGATNIDQTLKVTGSTELVSTLTVTDTTELLSDLEVFGDTRLAATSGNVSIGRIGSGGTDVYGDVEFNTGITQFQSPNKVIFNTTPSLAQGVNVTGSAKISTTLEIGGVANVSSSLSTLTTDLRLTSSSFSTSETLLSSSLVTRITSASTAASDTRLAISSSLALTITNLDTATSASDAAISSSFASTITTLTSNTSASDAALDTRVTTAEGHIDNLHAFTGSLNDTYATDAELAAVSGALATSINTSVAGLNAASSSYATTSSNNFIGTQTINGSILITGSATDELAFGSAIAPQIVNGDDSSRIVLFGDEYTGGTGFIYLESNETYVENQLRVRKYVVLDQQDPLPVPSSSIATGSLALTGSSLAFYDGTAWKKILTGSF